MIIWELSVAEEPVVIPDVVLSFKSDKKQAVRDLLISDYQELIQEIQKYEYGIIPFEENNEINLLYVDKSGFPNLCGHASFGLVELISTISKTEKEFVTPSGMIKGKRQNGNLELTMPDSFHLKSIFSDLNFVKSSDIAMCGNQYIMFEVANLKEHKLQDLQRISIELILKHKVYGVFWYEITGINGHIDSQSVTIFGEKGQIDLSPCGTGSSSLAILLTSKALLKPQNILNNYSLNNEKFSVSINNMKPTLTYRNNVKIINKHQIDFNLKQNWKQTDLKQYFNDK